MLPTLLAGYQHVWNHAAVDALGTAETALLPDQAERLLNDLGAGQLARPIADATSRGANPADVHSAAIALVLACRIQDYPTTCGVTRAEAADLPLPWRPAPRTGHPGWNDYLRLRAQLITHRVIELGSLTEAHREQHRFTRVPPGDIGRSPVDSNGCLPRRPRALRSDQSHPNSIPPRSLPSPKAAPVQPSRSRTQRRRRPTPVIEGDVVESTRLQAVWPNHLPTRRLVTLVKDPGAVVPGSPTSSPYWSLSLGRLQRATT